jgi:WD40 repeat protein
MAAAMLVLGGSDGRVRLVHAASGAVRLDVCAHSDEVSCVALSSGKLATAGYDRQWKIWDVASGEERIRGPLHDGKGVCSCEVDEHEHCTAYDQGCKLIAHAATVTVMSFSCCGNKLATAGVDFLIIVWGADGAAERRMRGHDRAIRALAFSSDGTHLASAGEDKKILIWSTLNGQLIRTIAGAHTGGETAHVPGWPRFPWGGVRSLAFSPDGGRIRSANPSPSPPPIRAHVSI